MLGVRLPENLDQRLSHLAATTNRSKSFYVKEALSSYLDVYEKTYERIAEYEKDQKNKTLELNSLDDVMKDMGISYDDLDL